MRAIFVFCGLGLGLSFVATNVNSQEKTTTQKTPPVLNNQGIPDVTIQKPTSYWMDAKLAYSKGILEDLTKGDFKKLSEEAQQLRLIGKMEGLVRRKDEDYRSQLTMFDLANQELIRQAKRGNAEGATLAFNQLTASCVACHVLLREGVE